MSKTKIPQEIKIRLWAITGGRCQFCNDLLWRDDWTMAKMNRAYIAHIIADEPGGVRGDPVLSPLLAKDILNLMLLCDTHHRMIDDRQRGAIDFPVERLQAIKVDHESRIEMITGIHPTLKSEILLYGANIGNHDSPISWAKGAKALIPERLPASPNGITLGMLNSAIRDHNENFWKHEEDHLRQLFNEQVKSRLALGNIEHLSVFAIAPQPLLILLGTLLSDIPTAEVYQLHKEPPDWCWQDVPEDFNYKVYEPDDKTGIPVLVLSLSAPIMEERIKAVLPEPISLWEVTLDQPDNDFLKSKHQLSQFRQAIRPLYDRIKSVHGEDAILRIFPAVPVSIAVELGRTLQKKAHLPLKVYDQNNHLGGFVHALDLNMPNITIGERV